MRARKAAALMREGRGFTTEGTEGHGGMVGSGLRGGRGSGSMGWMDELNLTLARQPYEPPPKRPRQPLSVLVLRLGALLGFCQGVLVALHEYTEAPHEWLAWGGMVLSAFFCGLYYALTGLVCAAVAVALMGGITRGGHPNFGHWIVFAMMSVAIILLLGVLNECGRKGNRHHRQDRDQDEYYENIHGPP